MLKLGLKNYDKEIYLQVLEDFIQWVESIDGDNLGLKRIYVKIYLCGLEFFI